MLLVKSYCTEFGSILTTGKTDDSLFSSSKVLGLFVSELKRSLLLFLFPLMLFSAESRKLPTLAPFI